MHAVLKEFGFIRSRADPCVFVLNRGTEQVMLFLYVDDNGITGSSLPLILEVKEFLKSKFSMKDLGLAEYILGIQIVRDAQQQTMALSQRAYFEQVLRRYGMEDCSPVKTPMEPGLKLEPLPAGATPCNCPYQSAIGSLMYGMLGTRPDLAFVEIGL